MVVNNLKYFENLLNGTKGRKTLQSKNVERVPSFRVTASLSAPEIVISPLTPDIYKMMVKLTRNIVDSTKLFHRWQNGTCILAPPQKVGEDEDPVVFSFHSDVLANQNIIYTISSLNNTITKTFGTLIKWIDTWRKYRPLWKVDKVLMYNHSNRKLLPIILGCYSG